VTSVVVISARGRKDISAAIWSVPYIGWNALYELPARIHQFRDDGLEVLGEVINPVLQQVHMAILRVL
jgi:hypothetical protein